MSSRFSIDVDLETLEKHLVAYTLVAEIFRQQSQPICLLEGDRNGLVFSLRVNLAPQQCERLIEKEINHNVPGYTCSVDWKKKELRVTKAKRARKTGGQQSAGADQHEAA